MVEKCSFQSKSYIILNIILFCILIGAAYYYYYISSRKPKEHFQQPQTTNAQPSAIQSTVGCFPHEQYEMDVVMRDCGVYFIDPTKEGECDTYFDYYDMTDVQLDYAIKLAEEKYPDILPKLQEIWNYLHGNGFKKCKIKYDNWKEVASYHDKYYQPETKNYVYPKKNTNNVGEQINFKLWNSCFAANTNLNKISFNDGVVAACTTPIKNIKDINSTDNEYVSMSFNSSINYENVYKSLCDKQTDDKVLNISSDIIFMVLHCQYKSRESLQVYDISFVQYASGKFTILQLTPAVNTAFLNLFRLTYDKTIKRIVYGPRMLDVSSHVVNYDVCNNIKNYILRNINFTFRDYNIPNITTDIVLNTVPELIDKFDEKINDNNSDNQTLMLGIIDELTKSINNENTQLDTNKSVVEIEVTNLVKLMADNMKGTRDKFSKFETYVAGILQSRKDTDIALYTYLEALKAFKAKIEDEFNRRKALIGSGQDMISGNFDTYITSENSRCMGLCGTVNEKLQEEYNKTSGTLVDIYQDVVDAIIGIFTKGVYVSVNFYNKGVLTRFAAQNEREFSCMIMNNSIAENFVAIASNRNPYYLENKYIKDASGMLYYLVELSGNILLQAGYYHFYADLIEEECYDIFIGYPDPQNNAKMIFKNVANYYYRNNINASDTRMRKDAGVAAAKSNDNKNNTTKLPIYIDGEYNNGYYAFYARSLRGIQTLRNNYLNMKYVRLNTANESYSLFGEQVYEYKAANTLNISIAKNVSDILYYNKEISDLKMISMYYNTTKSSSIPSVAPTLAPVPPPKKVIIEPDIYPTFEDELKYLKYWWKFDNNLIDTINKKQFYIINNYSGNIYEGVYTFENDAKYGNKSLMISGSKKYADEYMFKASTDVIIGNVFSISFWCKSTACCNKIISLGDDVYINIRKDINLANNTIDNSKDIFYINGISSNIIVKGYNTVNNCYEESTSSYGCFDSYFGAAVSAGTFDPFHTPKWRPTSSDGRCGYMAGTTTKCNGTKQVEVPNYAIANKIDAEFNKWNHFVLTYKGASLKLYYNGQLKHENKNYDFMAGIMNLSLFNQQSDNSTSVYYNDLRIYNKELSISEINKLYTNTTASTSQSPSEDYDMFPKLSGESEFLSYWWDFDAKLSGRVGGVDFQNNTVNSADFTYDTILKKYGPSSLKITPKTAQNNFKFSAIVNLPNTFTWSFWAYSSGCCNRIASIGYDIYIDFQNDMNNNIVYIHQISSVSSKQETYYDTCTSQNCTSCRTFADYLNQHSAEFGGWSSGTWSPQERWSSQKCESTCTNTTYSCTKTRPVNTSTQVLPADFNKWNFYTISYNSDTKTLKFYYNGEFKFETTNFTYYAGTKAIQIFNNYTATNFVNYSDMRIHSKELTPYEIYTLYNGGDINVSLPIVSNEPSLNCSDVIATDPGIRKINQRFYITCPKLPTISTLPKRPSILTFTMLKLPTLLNGASLNYVPIYTQEKTNLDNFYAVNAYIEQLDELRQIDISEFDCMIKAEKQMLINNVSQESIDNKRAIIERLNDQITINNRKITELTNIYNAINTFTRSYDYNAVKQVLNERIIFDDNTIAFNKYLPAVFKNLKDGKHYMYLAIS